MATKRNVLGQKLTEDYHKEAGKHYGYYSIRQWAEDKFPGLSDQSLSNYMLGKRNPSGENKEILLDVYGKKIFEWLGENVPEDWNPTKRAMLRRWMDLSPEAREKILTIARNDLAKQPESAAT